MPVPFCCHIPYLQNRCFESVHGGSGLVEGLDDLHTIHIFHNRAVHVGVGGHVLRHHIAPANQHTVVDHIANHAGSERGERHAPVDKKQIEDDKDRRQGAGNHLGNRMGNGNFQTVRIVHDKLLKLAGRFALYRSHRHFRHLPHDSGADIFDDFVSGLMGTQGRFSIEPMFQEKSNEGYHRQQDHPLYCQDAFQSGLKQHRHRNIRDNSEYGR